MRRHFAALLLMVLAAAVLVGIARADTAPPKKYKGNGVLFSYPGAWTKVPPGVLANQTGQATWQQWLMVGSELPPPGTMATDLVILAAFKLPVSITAQNFDLYEGALRAGIMQFIEQTRGTVVVEPARTSFGRLPALQLEIEVAAPDGTAVRSRLVLGFNKKNEYFLNCQHGVSSALAADVMSGCDLISQTFRLQPPKPKKKRR